MMGQLVRPNGICLPEHQLSHRDSLQPKVVNRVFGEGLTHVTTALAPLKEMFTNESGWHDIKLNSVGYLGEMALLAYWL